MDDWALPGFTELGQLGEGTFGRVVLARHDGSGQVVAIKYLFARFAGDPARLAEFRREAQVLSQVPSPYIARLYDFAETPQGAAIVLEAVHGVSLQQVLATDAVLEPEAALVVLKGSLLGLASAHAAGIVHRDYKPGNVLVSDTGQSKLVDFGTAVLSGEVGAVIGTPSYMAPEQWAGGAATPATDVYAATCVFFQCVAGHRPYQADKTEILRTLHEHAPIPFGEVPPPIRALIARGMAKDVQQRPAGAGEFVAELEQVARAGYGEDWERRGWSRLAKASGLLLALTPLAMFASAGTAAAPVAAAGAAATAGGTGGGVVLGVKVAIGVAVAAAVTTTVVVVSQSPGDTPPPVALTSFKVDVQTRTGARDGFDYNGQFVQISGLKDTAAQQRINTALAEPLDHWLEGYIWPDSHSRGPDPDGDIPHVSLKAQVVRQDDKILSVVYTREVDSTQFNSHTGFGRHAAVIDVQAGRVLEGEDIFDEAGKSEAGMAALEGRILAEATGGCLAETAKTKKRFGEGTLNSHRMFGGEDALQIAPAEKGMNFYVLGFGYGFAESCGDITVTVPYDKIGDLVRSDIAPLLGVVAARKPIADRETDFGAFTVSAPPDWQRYTGGDLDSYLLTKPGCTPSPTEVMEGNCPGFTVKDNSRALPDEPQYVPGKPYSRTGGPRSCAAAGKPGQVEIASVLVKKELRPIGSKKAAYEEWRITCNDGAAIVQRVWFLPKTQLVIVDEWNTPGLDKILEGAKWH
ncbi:serine/threonine-protein kinase [Amycolatopsis sp. H20-H5]|uniref:serine/threonine-protein kinase n=1 Tax=Amycolatopsis sp. H20-H5 TaxID=3046309 RepID=UPI002DBC2502|nr:serine/threonine-protein kinase [Amycolatopsis sp. H20-H5]MEC3981070.1 serine/threonine-protein kinase [Amycolatopsis sp. H20-H5]